MQRDHEGTRLQLFSTALVAFVGSSSERRAQLFEPVLVFQPVDQLIPVQTDPAHLSGDPGELGCMERRCGHHEDAHDREPFSTLYRHLVPVRIAIRDQVQRDLVLEKCFRAAEHQ